MVRVQDRTREHLGTSDKAIVQYRRILKEQIETVAAGRKPLLFLDPVAAHAIRGPATADGIGPTQGWETFWMDIDAQRRRNAPWGAAAGRDDKVSELSAAK
jgi:hypothetical protein